MILMYKLIIKFEYESERLIELFNNWLLSKFFLK